MNLRATPANVLALLLAALSMLTAFCLIRRKPDSNVPLLFYSLSVAYAVRTGRPLTARVFAAGLLLALMLRFEFLNRSLTRLALVLEILALGGIALDFVSDVFELRLHG